MSDDVKTDETQPEEETSEVELEEADGSETEKSEGIDYEAELNRLKELDRHKSGALKEERERRREAERKLAESEEETIDEDSVSSVVKKVLAEERKARVADELDGILDSQCKDSKYRDLVRFHYENTIKPTGESRAAIERDIARCKLLANESKYISEAQKKARRDNAEGAVFIREGGNPKSLKNEPTGKKGVFVSRDGTEVVPKTAKERELLKAFGVKQI